MESDSASLIIIVVCIIMSAYFSATETAFSSLNRIRVKNLAEKGNKKAKLVMKLSDNYDSLLSTILIGNNIVNIASASLATVLFVKMLGEDAGPSISTAVTTIVVLIFGEISPKSIAKESPEKFAMFSAPILNILVKVLTPFNFLFGLWKKLLSLIFKSSEDEGITEEELLSIVDEATEDGGIDEEESNLIHSALEFTEQEVIDILTPRVNVTAVPNTATKEEVAKVFAETAFSRLPVYNESIDNIVGIIYQKDFHNMDKEIKEIKEIIRPTLYVHKTKKINQLLKELQQKKMHFAVVLDEFGGTTGIVTLEDILEELVGEIWDEHDEVSPEIEIKSDDEIVALGTANIEKVFDAMRIETNEAEDIDSVTVNGWIMKKLEHIPNKEETFNYKNFEIVVLGVSENCVEKILIKKRMSREEI